jgi:hypothetical protein
VRLREEVLSGVEEVLLEGVADLAITGLSIPGYLGHRIERVEFIAVAHPDHPLHRLNRELSFQDLETQMQVVIRDSGRQQPRDVGWLGAEQRWTVGSLATAATFVSSGLGFAWLPRHMIEREMKEGSLKVLPLDKGGSRNPSFYLYSNKDKPLGPATQILIELLRTFDRPAGRLSPRRQARDPRIRIAAPVVNKPDTEFTDGLFRARRLQPALRGIWPRYAVAAGSRARFEHAGLGICRSRYWPHALPGNRPGCSWPRAFGQTPRALQHRRVQCRSDRAARASATRPGASTSACRWAG